MLAPARAQMSRTVARRNPNSAKTSPAAWRRRSSVSTRAGGVAEVDSGISKDSLKREFEFVKWLRWTPAGMLIALEFGQKRLHAAWSSGTAASVGRRCYSQGS